METIKDLWASLVAYANERSTNPLTSAFVLTWAGWNYKFFILLFEDVPSAEKFAAIDKLYPRPETYYGSGLLYPALTALFYVFAYPYITSWVVSFYRARQVEIANKVKAIEGDRVRTVEEVNRLVRDYERKLSAADIDAKAARAETVQVQEALKSLDDEYSKFKRANTGVAAVPTIYTGGRSPSDPRYFTPFDEVLSTSLFPYTSEVGVQPFGFNRIHLQILTLIAQTKPTSPLMPEPIQHLLELGAKDVSACLSDLERAQLISRTNAGFGITRAGLVFLRSLHDNTQLNEFTRDTLKRLTFNP